jgi:class 3 adenylate cyclase
MRAALQGHVQLPPPARPSAALPGAIFRGMARVCEQCGAEAAEEARFCAACGAPLGLEPGAERKLATMVFADLVGSTELASGADPEEIRRRLAPFFDVARASLQEHGGTLEKYVGDAVLAVFGVPRAHGDDPDRAVAAALDLVERLRAIDRELAVRIGVETGVVLSTGSDGNLSVTGEPVNAAARLQQAAAPGQVLVGERAARACRRAVLEPQEPVQAKGLPAPLAAWRAVGELAETDGSDLPLLGRDDDLQLLRLVHRRAVRERAPQLVSITGEAGIGKTRIANELMEELRADPEPPRILVGRNPPYGRGIAFWALGEILREAAGAGADDPVDVVRAGLRDLLTDLGAEDSDQISDALMVALGRSKGADGAEGVDAEEALKRAWRRLVALLAADRPLLVAVDDAHWADEGLLDLLEEVAFGLQEASLVVLCTSRPELYERRPDFGHSARNVTQVELRPLNASATTELAKLLLPAGADDLAARVARASGGNPFFAEEVARSISGDDGAASVDHLPDTVQTAIAARMDLLPAEEKLVLQHAAVLGHHFSQSALERLLGSGSREALDALERKALVQELIAAGAGHYAFRHQLIRDVAYASLPREERARLHEQAAEGVRTSAGERFVEFAELYAFHLAEAAELDPRADRRRTACEATLDAARIATRRGALARSQELYEHAAALAADDVQRAKALRVAGDVAIRRWRGDLGFRLLREAARVAERAGERGLAAAAYGRAVELASRMIGVTGELPEQQLIDMLERGRALVPDDDLATRAQLMLDEVWIEWGYQRAPSIAASFDAGAARSGAAVANEALELARKSDDPRLLSSALDAVGAIAWSAHGYQRSHEVARERLQLIRETPTSPALEIERNDARHMMIESSLQIGRFHDAVALAAEAREADLSHGVAYSAWSRGLYPLFFLGRWDETLEMAIKFREAWLAEERPPIAAMASALATAGAIHGYRGDEGASAEWFDVAEGMAQEGGQRGGVRLLKADVDIHRGRIDCAIEHVLDPTGGFWWHTVYLATRAECFVLVGRPDAEATLSEIEAYVGEQPYARAITLRARGQLENDPAAIERARALFAGLECPYQEARTGWLLGGEQREAAQRTFERLGTPPPVDGAG